MSMKLFRHSIFCSIACINLMFFIICFYAFPTYAADPTPGQACSKAGAYTKSGGPALSGANHFLVCQGGTWKSMLSTNASGQVTRIGNLTCGNGDLLRFDGTNWVCSPKTCNDGEPDPFLFTDLAGQSTSTLLTSDIKQVNGVDCVVNITITGKSSPQYRICSNADCSTVVQDWTSNTSTLTSGQYIQLRITTRANGGINNDTLLMIGNGTYRWRVTTTGGCAGSPVPGTVCDDGTIYVGTTPDGNGPMYITRCNIGQTWNGEYCANHRLTLPWNNGSIIESLSTGITSNSTGAANTTALVALSNSSSPYMAAHYCDQLDIHGHNDWYLPALNEMYVIQSSFNEIGTLIDDSSYYWTSSETGGSVARFLRINDGYAGLGNKHSMRHVRCARKG